MSIDHQINGIHLEEHNTNGINHEDDLDILIIGAGFAGIYLLYKLRKKGYRVKIYDASNDLGGTWHTNRYPGARTDSEVPIYELSIPEIWKTWTWKEKYPGWEELREYFAHVDKMLDIKKDAVFNTTITAAKFDIVEGKWYVETNRGSVKAKYLLACIGFAAKRYIPDFPGLLTFQGVVHHSTEWPEEDVDVTGKRCAVIGTGPTGVQIIQEWAKKAKSLVVFQRTPNLSLPMGQRKLTAVEQNNIKSEYPDFFLRRHTFHGGFTYGAIPRNTFDDTAEEREHMYESMWEKGGFAFWFCYQDVLFDQKANNEAYNFWAKKTRARIHDPRKRDLLAPLEPPHAFGTKRPSLEQDYFEMVDRPNVDLVDVKNNPIIRIEPKGIVTRDGKLHEVDVLALATGFDAVTGSLLKIDLKDMNGNKLSNMWKDGTKTYLGMSLAGYPNMFYTYGPQAPTAFANGPTLTEVQSDWIIRVIDYCEENNVNANFPKIQFLQPTLYVNPKIEAQEKWTEMIHETTNKTLFPLADSWYMGANIPGKKREMLNFIAGIPKYIEIIKSTFKNNLDGYEIVKY